MLLELRSALSPADLSALFLKSPCLMDFEGGSWIKMLDLCCCALVEIVSLEMPSQMALIENRVRSDLQELPS